MSLRMMIITIAAMSLMAASTAVASERHSAFTAILDNHVSARGLVNYTDLCADARLGQYTQTLSSTDWTTLSGDDQLAFWINAYNAFTLTVVCDSYPIDSINDLHKGGLALGTVFNTTIWDKKIFAINGEEMSLGHIEHNILREGPEKARIHFAIVCAAVSCPPLRAQAYEGTKIDAQLEAQGRIFLARADLNRFDLPKKRAYLSGIFKWFLKDFGRDKTELLRYLARYAPDPAVAESLRSEPGEWRIKWNKYDWSLNEQ
ncbi:MAG: DUF547 domain-containing protein [Candidatus Omnitrophica bacterium]|nr:DUF547 domain-containing protein [Candidatus Omnitrophota bacterium]